MRTLPMGLTSALALGVTITLAGASGQNVKGEQDHGGGHQHHGNASSNPADLPSCPLMGNPVNFGVKTNTTDGPVFFCCKACIKKYENDPDKYAPKVDEQRRILAKRSKVQVTCPVSSEVVDRSVSLQHAGQKVFFCCRGCVNKFKNNPDKYQAALANSYTYQTKCPVMGEDIDPQAFMVLSNGHRVFFCCARCESPLRKDPAKYSPNLVAQGFDIIDIKGLGEKETHPGHDHSGHNHDGH